MKEIGFLHLSDLHFGDINQKGLISQTRMILFEDIKFIMSKLGSLDYVFFTGDLVQKGTEKEYDQLEGFLKDLWSIFKTFKQNPYLICVPGNHDLERVDDTNIPTQKVMMNWNKESIKNDYFWNSPNCYHEFVIERFKNYRKWYENTSIRKPQDISWGYLPGDFYCSLNQNDIKLGIVGLNSSFLQLEGGDFKGKLGVYHKQITHLFNENYYNWLQSNDLSLLLTHHSSDWFEPCSLDEFHQVIYNNDSFHEHLCGHLHEPSYTKVSINNFPFKRTFVSPSLFGLEYFGGKSKLERVHGYTAGIYKFESNKIKKIIWPRISHITKTKVIKIVQNEEFNLDKESQSSSEIIKEDILGLNKSIDVDFETIKKIEENGGNLFSQRAQLNKTLTRTLYKASYSHLNIRLTERIFAIRRLQNQKYCWIVTKFGLAEDEFIGSILDESSINPGNCFSIDCDEILSIDDLINSFNNTFSQNITEFFDSINSLEKPLVVFNKLNDELINNIGTIKEFIQTIFDFSPDTKILFISTLKPDNRVFESIELSTLDVPAVKQYIENSQELSSSFTFLEFEKIHRISSGIPLYVDKVIEQLKFRPLSDLGEMEFENSSNNDIDGILAKATKNEITMLKSEDSKESNRKFKLLSILSLLHNGETFNRIRRFDPNNPFYSDDISYLLKSKLIETVQINSIFNNKQTDSDLIKIIKIPRLIRDYISSLISEDEKIEIYKQACSLYLGSNWRIKIKLIQPISAELDIIVYQNLQIALRYILSIGIERGAEVEIKRITRITLSLIEYFSDNGAYKDAISLSEETLLLIKDVKIEDIESARIYLIKTLGENLRMTSFHDRSIDILKSICDDENNSLSKKDRNNIRLSIAYAYETQYKKEEALNYANQIKKNESNKNSNIYLSAESVIAHFIEDKTEKIRKLNTIRNKADKYGFNTLKANIILEICRISNDESQIKLLDRIIVEAKDDIYNRVRAWAAKAEIILNTKKIEEITNDDLIGLNISYSYSFYQRLQRLLNKCHKLAWQYWSRQNRYDQLLNLFRYSSFVWRLCGDYEQEQIYIDELHSNEDFIEWFKLNKIGINSSYYEQRIFTLYNKDRRILELKE